MADTTNGQISGSQASLASNGLASITAVNLQDVVYTDLGSYQTALDNVGGCVMTILSGAGAGICRISQQDVDGKEVASAAIQLKDLPGGAINIIGDDTYIPGVLNFRGMPEGQSGSLKVQLSGNLHNILISGVVGAVINGPGVVEISIPFST